jgi:hypothetical protein
VELPAEDIHLVLPLQQQLCVRVRVCVCVYRRSVAKSDEVLSFSATNLSITDTASLPSPYATQGAL